MHHDSLPGPSLGLAFFLSFLFPLSLIDFFSPLRSSVARFGQVALGAPPFQACVFYTEASAPAPRLWSASASGNARLRRSGRSRLSGGRARHSGTISALMMTPKSFCTEPEIRARCVRFWDFGAPSSGSLRCHCCSVPRAPFEDYLSAPRPWDMRPCTSPTGPKPLSSAALVISDCWRGDSPHPIFPVLLPDSLIFHSDLVRNCTSREQVRERRLLPHAHRPPGTAAFPCLAVATANFLCHPAQATVLSRGWVQHESRCCCGGIFRMCLAMRSVRTKQSRSPSRMRAGLVQSVQGLQRKDRRPLTRKEFRGSRQAGGQDCKVNCTGISSPPSTCRL